MKRREAGAAERLGVVLFHTSSSALRAEQEAQTGGFQVKLIPPPRELSSDCGIALRFNWSDKARLVSLLAVKKVETAGVHALGTVTFKFS